MPIIYKQTVKQQIHVGDNLEIRRRKNLTNYYVSGPQSNIKSYIHRLAGCKLCDISSHVALTIATSI